MRPETVQLQQAMRGLDYVAEPSIVTAVYLAQAMEKPLLVEGDAGVGKTEIAKVMAGVLDTELIRLQCYEGLDANAALYEWNYQKQLLRLRIASDGRAASDGRTASDGDVAPHGQTASGGEAASDGQPAPDGDAAPHGDAPPHNQAAADADDLEDLIFSRRYLLERPLLRAITSKAKAPVLLVDEIDRADGGFEAFLLEVLSDFQVTIPELGTIRAERRPLVVLTSNRTRELGDALRRRCLYLYIEHPTLEKETEIIRAKVPGVAERLADQIARFAGELRARRLAKPPGVAETLDWAAALVMLHKDRLDADTVNDTLGCMIKDRDDMRRLDSDEVSALVEKAGGSAAATHPGAPGPDGRSK